MNKSEKTAITSIAGIIMIVILAIATSCSTTSKVSITKYGMHVNKNYNTCPAYI